MSTELNNLAKAVLANYDINPKTIKVIQSGGIKTVWKFDTDSKSFCLKRLRQTLEKALFTINAQNYMAGKGAKVPAIYPTKDGKLYAVLNGELFVMYQWVVGKNLYMQNAPDLKQALHAIAAFHRDSAGYHPPENCRVSTKLGRWPHYYTSVMERLRTWKQVSTESPNQSLSKAFLANVDSIIKIGEQALSMLEKSSYNDWVKQVEKQRSLCHQDYGDGNVLLTPEGPYVIDFDSVTYDLPVRDLRKIIVKRMATRGSWDKDAIHSITRHYSEVNPLTPQQLQVLYIDLLFPHEFHDTAKNPFRKNKPTDASKISKAARFDQSKVKLLESLIQLNS